MFEGTPQSSGFLRGLQFYDSVVAGGFPLPSIFRCVHAKYSHKVMLLMGGFPPLLVQNLRHFQLQNVEAVTFSETLGARVSMMVLLEWLNLMVAEPKRGDERDDGFTLKFEGVLAVTLVMASVVTAWMAPMTPLMASMAPTASLGSMVASMALVVVLLASMALMVASLEWLRLMTEPKRGGKRGDGLIHKICEERADELTHNNREERADGLTYRKVVIQVLVDGDGSESGGFRWTKTRATSCLRRTQKKSIPRSC